MKLELYKPYRTRGGWKAVVVEISECGNLVKVAHDLKTGWDIEVQMINGDYGDFGSNHDFAIIEEWKEPRTVTKWMTMCSDGVVRLWDVQPSACSPWKELACKKITITEGEGL